METKAYSFILGKFGLRLNLAKTPLLVFGKRQAWQAWQTGQRLPTFAHLVKRLR